MSDSRYELLVAFHELIEVFLCKMKGVTQKEVDSFDKAYEKRREAGKLTAADPIEPGDHPGAPYRHEHFIATTLERLFAVLLCVDWLEYEKEVDNL